MTTGELFRSTLPLEVVVKKLSVMVGPPNQGLRVRVDPIDERVPHLLLERSPLPLTGDKGPNTHWVHGENIEIAVNI